MSGPVQRAFERYNQAMAVRGKANPITPKHNEDVWQAVVDTLEAYRSEENGAAQGEYIEPLPAPVAIVLEQTLKSIIAGYMPPSLDAFFSKGAPATHPIEKIDQQNAVLYVSAAKAEILDDKSPIKTIHEKFGVAKSTCRRWIKLYPTNAAEWHPEWDVQRGEIIRKQMERSAARYRVAGRRHGSILARARKRTADDKALSGPNQTRSDSSIGDEIIKNLNEFTKDN